MAIPKQMMQSFNKAVSLSENLLPDGSVNWNFVDADVYMELSSAKTLQSDMYMVWFNELADAYVLANGENTTDYSVLNGMVGHS